MEFIFFSAADAPLFARGDAESANWTVHDLQLTAAFPYDPDKIIARGQRVGFVDADGIFQPFEIRKVKSYEPDHYQEITAEHICISELTDEHTAAQEFTDATAAAALGALLTGTLWSIGNDTSSGTATADVGMGSVWQGVRTIEANWNVYITPRVTFDASGITHRYLDISPAGGTWRGLRLSVDKNADDVGVTWDDTGLATALYGYGGSANGAALTFSDVVWSATSDHPAKPSGQAYIEDPAATAAYGRNGRARFGFYQNSSIKDASVLIEKTWEALKQAREPAVTIDCSVRDYYRMGYADQPIRLHDTVIIDVEPIGVSLERMITALTVDLLDPTATRPTIGAYIPNIVYLTRETARRSGGGGGRGGGGGYGQSAAEYERQEFETEIAANAYQITLKASQNDLNTLDGVVAQARIDIDAQGVTIGAMSTDLNGLGQRVTTAESSITTQANQIALVVTGTGQNAAVNAASIVTAVNNSGSSVTIDADKVYLNGDTIATSISANSANIANLANGTTTATLIKASNIVSEGQVTAATLSVGGAIWASKQLTMSGLSGTLTTFLGSGDVELGHYHAITATEGTGADSGKIFITLSGAVPTTDTTQHIANFNIAATQKYRTDVAAAAAAVTIDSVARLSGNTFSANKKTVYFNVKADASNGATLTQQVSANVTDSYNQGADDVTVTSVTHVSHTTHPSTTDVTVSVLLSSGNSFQKSFSFYN